MIALFPFYTLFQIVAIILPQSELKWQAINNNCPAVSGETFALCFNFSRAPQLYGRKGGDWGEDGRGARYLTISPLGDVATRARPSCLKHINQHVAVDTCSQEYETLAYHMAYSLLPIKKKINSNAIKQLQLPASSGNCPLPNLILRKGFYWVNSSK